MFLSIAFLLYSFRKQTSPSKPKPVYHKIWSDSGEAIINNVIGTYRESDCFIVEGK